MKGDFDFFGEYTNKYRHLIVVVPAEVLSSEELSFNEKILLGLDFTFKQKLGFNMLTNKEVGKLFNIHPNIVSSCRKNLVENGYLTKEKRKYLLTDKIFEEQKNNKIDKRSILIPNPVYSLKIPTGAKLLWGEYNSFSEGLDSYDASREFTSNRLKSSRESITNWTKILEENNLITVRYIFGYGFNQKEVTTYRFD